MDTDDPRSRTGRAHRVGAALRGVGSWLLQSLRFMSNPREAELQRQRGPEETDTRRDEWR